MVQPAAMPFASFTGGSLRRTAVKMASPREMMARPEASRSKLDPALAAVTGVVRVQIWLADTQPATLAALKKLGFELTGSAKTAKLVIGRIDAAKLREAAALASVKWIAPAP
jgi:hypothetical protein